ncbi:hypothetical protein [Sphingomonas sp. KR3-1]|uniref:hypothetical protein n=1 Tax=Sphingomonas sp. KR3-1 TaxID=3156611 RepID=UPI0032B5F2A6
MSRGWLRTAALAFLLAASCSDSSPVAATQIFVLVDLSKTWLNPGQQERNRNALTETMAGIVQAANDSSVDQPIEVQERAIGSGSLERLLLCHVRLKSTIAPIASSAPNEVNNTRKLASYLNGDSCNGKVLGLPPEQDTEISSALLSVGDWPGRGAKRRILLVLSDFLEETDAPSELPADMTGFEVLLIYRPVSADFAMPASMRIRMDEWRQLMTERHAKVEKVPDTALSRQLIADYLIKGIGK